MSEPSPSGDFKEAEIWDITNLKKIADLSPNILYVIDVQDLRVLYVSKKVDTITAYDSKYIISKGREIFKSIFHPDDYRRRMESLEKCRTLSGEEECHVEARMPGKENKWEWYRFTEKIFSLNKDGEVTHVLGIAQNIHKQKESEEKLREERRRLEDAQKIGHIGSFERELSGDILKCSDELFNILGIEPGAEGLSKQEFFSFVQPDDLETLKNAVDKTHAIGEPLDTVTRMKRPDNTIRYIHMRAAIRKDEKGIPVRVYGTMQDISGRIKDENKRKRAEKLMRSTEILAGMGSYEVNLNTNDIYFSEGLCRIFGEEPDVFIPSAEWIEKHSHPDDVPVVQRVIDEAIRTKTGYNYTRRIYRKDGSLRILEVHGRFVDDSQGVSSKIIGLVQDITERKQAEEELRRSEKQNRNLLEVLKNAPDAYLVLTPDFRIKFVNEAYLYATNSIREEITGKNIFEVFPDNPNIKEVSSVKSLKASLEKVLETKKLDRLPILHYDVPNREGGFIEKYWIPTNAPVLNSTGEVEYIIHRALDITDLVKEKAKVEGLVSETEMLKNSLEKIKLHAQELKDNKALLQSVFDASPNSIILYKILYDSSGKPEDFEFFMVNEYNYQSLNLSRDLNGKRYSEVFPNVHSTGILDHFKKTAVTGEPADFEVWYEGQGLQNWFHFRLAKLGDLLLATAEDITERKQSEETIQQMLNGSIAAITILQSIRNEKGEIIDFKIKGANRAAETINKVPNYRLIGENLLEIFPGIKGAFFNSYVKVVETGEPLRVQRSYNNEPFDHWFDVSAVKNGDGFIMTFQDISEQKKAEQELIQLKEELTQKLTDKYRKIINSMDDGFCLIEIIRDDKGDCVDYRFLDTNPVFEAQTGLKEVQDKTVNELIPNLENYWKEIYGNVALTGKSTRFEDYAEAMGRWFEVNAFRIGDPNEQQVALMFKDITERKEAEERKTFLLNLNNALRSLDDPPKIQEAAMYILGKHLEANRAYYSEILEDEDTMAGRLGYVKDMEPLSGKVKISDFSPELRQQFLDGKTLVQEDIVPVYNHSEYAINRVNRSLVRALIIVPLVKNGKLAALVVVQQKTPRRWTPQEIALVEEVGEQTWIAMEKAQAEKALRESEQRFRNLVEASALAVWETEPNGIISKDSPSWRDFTGQTYEEWTGGGWAKAIHSEDRSFASRKWKEAIINQTKFDEEFRLLSASGDSRWTSVKAIPIFDIEGKVTKWSGMNIDIHNRKLTEEALIQAKEEAEAASKAKEDFVSTMSHEIRTPLNAIIGLTNLLMDQKPREDQKENFSSLSFSARNLLVLINDILDFSKLDAGKMEISEIDFNLPDLLSNLQKAHHPQAKANKSSIIIDLEKKIPEIIATDQVKLSQVLHNLVGNAVKFTHQGEIKISVKLNRQDKNLFWLDFAVQDTGIGIAADKVDHIFDKFAQAESSTVRNYGGTGLGLSITKLLLELLGSDISLESKLGEGSRFYFTLPVKKGFRNVAPLELEEINNGSGDLSHLRLLLVEDVEINRKILMQFLLNWWQLVPDEAVNGKEAVDKARNSQYDLILMDIRMPEMDGYEATSLIRNLPQYKETPILALTADKKQEAKQAQQATQFSDILTKPFEPGDLKKRILHHLSISVNDPLEPEGFEEREVKFPANHENKADQKPERDNMNSSEPVLEISRYKEICAGNSQILEKLIRNAMKAFETYEKEFAIAANAQDLKSLSDLVHKNTTSVHYIKANQLANKIEEFREYLQSPAPEKDVLDDLKISVLSNFRQVIKGLKTYLVK